MRVFQGPRYSRVAQLAFAPDGATLAVVFGDGQVVWLYDTATGQVRQRLSGHTRRVRDVAYSPDGTRLATVDHHGWVRFWDTATSQYVPLPQPIYGHKYYCGKLGFTADGRYLVASGRTVCVWDAQTGAPQRLFRAVFPLGRVVRGLAVSPNRLRVAWSRTDEPAILVSDLDPLELWSLPAPRHFANPAFRPDARELALSNAERIWFFDLESRTLRTEIEATAVLLSYSPDGQWLATREKNQTVALRDPRSGTIARRYQWDLGYITQLQFAPDGLTAAVGGEHGRILVWDVESC